MPARSGRRESLRGEPGRQMTRRGRSRPCSRREHDQRLRDSLNQSQEGQREDVKRHVAAEDRVLDPERHAESPGKPLLPTSSEEETDECKSRAAPSASERSCRPPGNVT